MTNEIKTVWTKRESKRGIEPQLLARCLSRDWLGSSIQTTSVRFTGALMTSLVDLREASKASSKNLPITSLRLLLLASMEGVIHVDKELGCDSRFPAAAIELHKSETADDALASKVAEQVQKWCTNFLELWAQKEQFGELAVRVKQAAVASNISLTSSQQYLRDPQTQAPNFPLIVRLIAEQLTGEVLFEGMGRSELILPLSPTPRTVELMSEPRKPLSEAGGKNAFSMVARVQVSTAPYSQDVYFSISCSKRVWAEKAPDGGNTGIFATAYVLAPGRPIIPVGVVKRKKEEDWGWDFDAEYASLNIEAGGVLPANLQAAFDHLAYASKKWWVGLPQVTRLYRRVDQHTALESDEVDLMRTVLPMLEGVVDAEVSMLSRRLTLNKKPESAMLRLEDVGAAGLSIADLEEEDAVEEGDPAEEGAEGDERAAVTRFREQCVSTLNNAHAGPKPALWVIGGSAQEQDLACKTAEILFGDAIVVSKDPLPLNVHGLKGNLPGSELKSRQRFSLRVDAWKKSGLLDAIAQHRGAKFVLICADRVIDRRTEDSVNRRAAIHAICSVAGASVHHVLPIEPVNSPARLPKATQSFIHRLQSAMMDVMLAHSGYVIGAGDFVSGQLDAQQRPKAVYGIQALRRQAQRYTGETPVCMVIYSRLILSTNITEVNFAYQLGGQTRFSGWMPLSKGLIWLGSQRAMDGDEDWLRAEFQKMTINTLNSIQAEDPRGVVFIDWGTIAGLWKDLTDANLLVKPPAIGHLDLASTYPFMSFARIRYGRDALMPVRSWSKTMYEGFREEASRQATGEYFEDGYAITVKQLLEINPDPRFPDRGHYVGVMSPRKTFQLKRGKSCYRFMVRMSPLDEKGSGKREKGVFEKVAMPPSDKDATIPSSMDITVLQAPSKDVAPLDIATLAMGLRVGYAHYDDWTTLPAPLFFARKIDDYIIKYPSTEEEVLGAESVPTAALSLSASEVSDDAPEAGPADAANESLKLKMVTKLIQEELHLEIPGPDEEPVASTNSKLKPSSPEAGASVPLEGSRLSERQAPEDEDGLDPLIAEARKVQPIAFYPTTDNKLRRVYAAMVRGQIKIQVDVPYFVQLPGFFGKYRPEMKKNIQRSWRQIRSFGYVAPSKPCPDNANYLDWLADKLRHPQGAYMTNAPVLFNRALIMPEIHDILNGYNLDAPERIGSFVRDGGTISIDFSPVVVKACQDNDDHNLAWLIFGAAQTPSFGFFESVIQSVTTIPGPMTRAALTYYIQCAQAIKTALQDYSTINAFKEIHLRRQLEPPLPDPQAPAAAVEALTTTIEANAATNDLGAQVPDVEMAPSAPAPAPVPVPLSAVNEDADTQKSKIKALAEQLDPGSPNFAADMLEMQVLLDKLSFANAHRREQADLLAKTASRRQEVAELARSLLARIASIDEEAFVPSSHFVAPRDSELEAAEADAADVEKAVSKTEVLHKQLLECLTVALPSGSPRSEMIRRAQQMSGLDTAIKDELVQIKCLLEVSPYFELSDAQSLVPPGEVSRQEQEDISSEDESSQDLSVIKEVEGLTEVPQMVVAIPAAEPLDRVDTGQNSARRQESEPADSSATVVPIAQPTASPVAIAKTTEAVADDASASKTLPTHEAVNPSGAAGDDSTAIAAVATYAIPKAQLTRNEHALEAAYSRLKTLMDLRHYGLAGVYIDAIKASFKVDQVAMDCDILCALAETLETIDCSFVIDARLNPALRAQLSEDDSTTPLRPAMAIGVLAAGFPSALFSAGQAGGGEEEDVLWTVIGPVRAPLTGMTALSALIDLLASRENKGIVLTRDKFSASKIGSKMAMEVELERYRRRAESWKDDAEIHASWAHHGFSRMHDYIYSTKHPIGQCMALAAKGDLKGLKKTFDNIQGKFRKPSATIVEAFKQVGEKSKPDGRYNVNACENIEITERFLRAILERSEPGFMNREHVQSHELDYLKSLHTCLTQTIAEIENLAPEIMLEKIYLESAKTVFGAVLRLFDESAAPGCMPAIQQKLLVQQPMDKLLNPSIHDSDDLGVKAVCSGESVIQVIDDLLVDDIGQLTPPVEPADMERLLIEAQRAHVEERRFLPAMAIEGHLPRGVPRLEPPLLQQYQKVRADLSRELQNARQRVTHAMALSALDQKDASHLLRIIESIHAANTAERGIGHPDGGSSAYPDFPHALAALQNQVIKLLDTRLEEAKDKLLVELKELEEIHGEEIQKDAERIRYMLQSNNPASIRTAHDACAILRSSGKLPAYVLNAGRNPPKAFDEFIASLSRIRGQHMLLDALETVLQRQELTKDAPPCILALDSSQRLEAVTFIKDWKSMCTSRGEQAAEAASTFFASLGIGAPDYLPELTGRQQPAKFEFPAKAFAPLASSDCFIPPALGSNAKIIVGYVIHGNHLESEIASMVQDVSSPTFILSRAGLTLSKRAKLSGRAPVILIDDHLIAYMALHPEDRARRMMEIGTLTFHTLPYSAEGTYVPREMFFGRQRELISLRAVKSLAILYGGRRLGKSSLLAQIEREESSLPGSVAIYIPMDRDYAGNDHVLFAWKKLYSGLLSRSVIQAMSNSESDWRKIQDWVEDQLSAATQKMRSCYLLFDEADNLMSHELELKPGETGFIRSLQQTSENLSAKFHLRYVVAGLHNLARWTTESNSALGKAETIALEPFTSDDNILRGIELVTKPMAALGFFFEAGSEDLPLRVLSICNFYPAFIQIYCAKLLGHMYNKRGTREAYADITVQDLEAVEKDHDLLTELQQKFSWTLDLDKRYKAIALILADHYHSEVEQGKNEGLTVSEIRTWCEVLLEKHFHGLSGGAYEALVDEMRKLNVLEKSGSRYRLRSPSIAMLIGDRARIDLQLQALADAQPEKARNHGDRRNELMPMGTGSGGVHAPIFPMPVAWTHAQMETVDGSLIILAGNNLCGLSDITSSRTEWQLTQNDTYRCTPLTAASASTYLTQLRRHGAAVQSSGKLLLVSTSVAWKVNEIPQFRTQATRAAGNGIRLALVAFPERMYEIAKALDAGTLSVGKDRKSDWSVSPVPPWSVDAVRFFLHDNSAVAEHPEACQAILTASCGFGKQIQSICAGNLTLEKALGLPEKAKIHFAPSLAVFYDKIGMPNSVAPEVLKRMEEFMVHMDGEKRDTSIASNYLQDFNLKPADQQFLVWMGLLQDGENNTWFVPELYRRLLE